MYNRKDHYYKKAKEEGRASRASYKLEQIQAKYNIIKKGDVVVDLGCAPGGWMEVASEMVGPKGLVVGIDLLPLKISLKANMRYMQGDITTVVRHASCVLRGEMHCATHNAQRITHDADVILSDMAPNTSGVAFKDAYLSFELAGTAFETAKKMLKQGGNFITKVFQGAEVDNLKQELKRHFEDVKAFIPPATRQTSKEIYLICMRMKG